MIVLIVIGGIVAVSLAAAALYDRRARRRGWKVGVAPNEGFDNRADLSAAKLEPFVDHNEKD